MYILTKLSLILISIVFMLPVACMIMENEIHRRKRDKWNENNIFWVIGVDFNNFETFRWDYIILGMDYTYSFIGYMINNAILKIGLKKINKR